MATLRNLSEDFATVDKDGRRGHLEISEADFRRMKEREVDELKEIFRDTFAKLAYDYAGLRLKPSFFTTLRKRELLKKVKKTLATFEDRFVRKVAEAIEKAAINGLVAAKADLEHASTKLISDEDSNNILDDVSSFAIDATTNYVAAQVRRMELAIMNQYASDAFAVSRRMQMTGESRDDAASATIQEDASNGDLILATLSFQDRAGRSWDAERYFTMLGTNSLDVAQREAYVGGMIAGGHDLVRISSHGAKDRCSRWEGKIISLTGATEGYPTYQETRASGDIWHPNCRHFLIPVFFDQEESE